MHDNGEHYADFSPIPFFKKNILFDPVLSIFVFCILKEVKCYSLSICFKIG